MMSSCPVGLTPTPKKCFKKYNADQLKNMMQLLYESIVINGGTYCRRHLRIRCHVCDMDYQALHDEANKHRSQYGIRCVGDAGLNALSAVIGDKLDASLILELEEGNNDGETAIANYTDITDDLNGVVASCTQCAFYGCPNTHHSDPSVDTAMENLRACSRCHVVKYCSAACQTSDWKWEHRYECIDPTGTHRTLL